MTINLSDNSPRISYTVAESVTQTSFTVPFEFFADADLNVYVDGTLKTLTTDYTTTGGDGSTGSIAMSVTGATGGSTVVITRDIAIERTTDFPTSGPFNIGSLNTELDRLTAVAADLEDLAGRGVKLADFDTQASLTLPLASDRPNKVLGFNSAGDALVTQELGTNKGDWATSTAYLERDIVRDSSTGSIYIVNSAHTSTGSTPLDTNFNSAKYDVIFDVDDMVAGNVTASGDFSINGNTTLGDASTDTVVINAGVNSNVLPSINNSTTLGSTAKQFNAVYADRFWAGGASSTSQFAGNVNVNGETTLNADVTLGNADTDDISFTGRVATDIVPRDQETFDLGSSTKRWDNSYVEDGHFTRVYTQQVRSETNGALEVRHEHASTPLRFILDDASVRYEMGVNSFRQFTIAKPWNGYTAPNVFRMYEPPSSNPVDWNFAIGESTVSALDWTIQSGNTGVDSVLHGDLSIDGDMNIDGSTQSTSTSTGALIVDGGVGIAKDVYAGGNVSVSGNATITGDLTVNGTTTTISTNNTVVSDALMELGNGTTGTPANDAGIVIERGDSDNAFIGWDESTDKFTLGTGSFTGASTGNLTITTGTLVADIEGDVTGNVTGNLDGIVGGTTPAAGSFTTVSASTSITGDLTGDLTGDVKATNGTVVLDNGTDGTDATITATLTGNVTGNLTGDLVGTTTDTKALAPDTDSSYDIGTTALRYRAAYVDKHYFTETVETTYSITPTTSQVAVDPANGNIQYVTLNSNSLSVSLVSWEAGQTVTLMIDDGANYSLNWPVMTWVNNNGSNPTLKTSGYTVVTIWRVGTLYYGAVVGAA